MMMMMIDDNNYYNHSGRFPKVPFPFFEALK